MNAKQYAMSIYRITALSTKISKARSYQQLAALKKESDRLNKQMIEYEEKHPQAASNVCVKIFGGC